MENAFNWIQDHWGICAFALSIVIQFTPAIKWNPISALFGWIGKIIVKPVEEKLDRMTTEIVEIREQQWADEKDRIRYEVLEFANTCRNGRRHTRDEYQHIISLKDKYEKLLEKTNDKNGVFEEEYSYIVNLYHKCQVENDFLI